VARSTYKRYACSSCSPGSRSEAVRVDITKQIKTLRGLVELVPEETRGEYLWAMDTALEIVEIRNGVVHGIHLPNADETMWQSQRLPRSRAAIPGEKDFLAVDYNRELLLGAGLHAKDIGGFIQVNTSRWPNVNCWDSDDYGDEDKAT
jgi:hypothetical protein